MGNLQREFFPTPDVVCLADVPARSVDRTRWLPWHLDTATRVLYVTKPYYYEIDLDRCNTSAEVLDWIFQIVGKSWATPPVIAGLVHAFDDVLNPQAHLCSFGRSTVLTVRQVKRLCNKHAR